MSTKEEEESSMETSSYLKGIRILPLTISVIFWLIVLVSRGAVGAEACLGFLVAGFK